MPGVKGYKLNKKIEIRAIYGSLNGVLSNGEQGWEESRQRNLFP